MEKALNQSGAICHRKLPNLIIAGVNKGGTTSLFAYLAEHPDICTSKVKETCYFLPLRYGEPMSPLEGYRDFFAHCGAQRYIMESTPGYFYGGGLLAQTVANLLGPVRILIILRDPVDRIFSFYRFMKNMMHLDQDMAFEDYIEHCQSMKRDAKNRRANNTYWGLDGGYYAVYLKDWFEVFHDNLQVLFFDDLCSNPVALLRRICAWLEIDPSPYRPGTHRVAENRTIKPRLGMLHKCALRLNAQSEAFFRSVPALKRLLRRWYFALNESQGKETLSAETREYLTTLYRPSNSRVAQLLHKKGYRNLPPWLDS